MSEEETPQRRTSRRTRQVIRYDGAVVRNYGNIINEDEDDDDSITIGIIDENDDDNSSNNTTGNIDENIDEDEDNITIGNIETETNENNNNSDDGQGQGPVRIIKGITNNINNSDDDEYIEDLIPIMDNNISIEAYQRKVRVVKSIANIQGCSKFFKLTKHDSLPQKEQGINNTTAEEEAVERMKMRKYQMIIMMNGTSTKSLII